MKLSFALLILIVPLVLCAMLLFIAIPLLFQHLFKLKSSNQPQVYTRQVSWEDELEVA